MKSFKNDDKVQLDLTTVDNHAFAIMGAFKNMRDDKVLTSPRLKLYWKKL